MSALGPFGPEPRDEAADRRTASRAALALVLALVAAGLFLTNTLRAFAE